MKGKFKVICQLYEVDKKLGPKAEGIEFSKDGYKDVESLKEDGKALVEAQIKKHNIPDGDAMLDIQIVENKNGTEVYVDNDSLTFVIKDGKMTEIETN